MLNIVGEAESHDTFHSCPMKASFIRYNLILNAKQSSCPTNLQENIGFIPLDVCIWNIRMCMQRLISKNVHTTIVQLVVFMILSLNWVHFLETRNEINKEDTSGDTACTIIKCITKITIVMKADGYTTNVQSSMVAKTLGFPCSHPPSTITREMDF